MNNNRIIIYEIIYIYNILKEKENKDKIKVIINKSENNSNKDKKDDEYQKNEDKMEINIFTN